MRKCNCKKNDVDKRAGNIIIEGPVSYLGEDTNITCINCGKVQRINRLSLVTYPCLNLNIIDKKISVKDVVDEYKIITSIFKEKKLPVDFDYYFMLNLLVLIVEMYHSVYYDCFSKFKFDVVRKHLISFVSQYPYRITDIETVKKYLKSHLKHEETFNLRDFLQENIEKEGIDRVEYGPASIGATYIDYYENEVESGNAKFLRKQDYLDKEKEIKAEIKRLNSKICYLLKQSLLENVREETHIAFENFKMGTEDLVELAKEINIFLKGERDQKDEIYLKGFAIVFENILNYIPQEVTYNNYSEIISKLNELLKYVSDRVE